MIYPRRRVMPGVKETTLEWYMDDLERSKSVAYI